MKKLLIFILFVISTVTFSQTTQNENVLKEGTILKIILNEEINGKTASAGQSIEFKLGEDLVINNVEIAPRGAKVIGKITEAERSKAMGKKGSLAFTIDYLYLENGNNIKLSNQVKKNLKGGGAAVAAGAILLSPAALLFNGKNAKYAKGEIFDAFVDEDYKF